MVFYRKKKSYKKSWKKPAWKRYSKKRRYTSRKRSYRAKPYRKKTTAVMRKKKSKKSIYTTLTTTGHVVPTGPVLASTEPNPLSVSFNLLPANKYFRCPYVVQQDLAPVGGTQSLFYMRLNGIYDPEVALGGHQPLWHDQLAAFYKAYEVMSSHITVTFRWKDDTNKQDGTTGPVRANTLCFVIPTDTQTSPNAAVYSKEEIFPSCCRTLKPDVGDSVTIKYSCYPKTFFSIKDPQDDETLYAAFTNDPTRTAYACIGIQCFEDAPLIGQPLNIHTKIVYNVRCFQPQDALPSALDVDHYVTVTQDSDDLDMGQMSLHPAGCFCPNCTASKR